MNLFVRVSLLAVLSGRAVIGQEPPAHPFLPVGLFITSIEEGGRIFTPVRLLPFEHQEALGHQFPTVQQLHRGEDQVLLHIGLAAGLRLGPTLQRYPTQPDSLWPYPGFSEPPVAAILSAPVIALSTADAALPGLRALAVVEGIPIGFIVDTRGLSLADRGMSQSTAMGLDMGRGEFLDALTRSARPAPAKGPAVIVFTRPADPLRNDWADLAHYREANRKLGDPRPGEARVVFFGNSITEAWAPHLGTMFPGRSYVGRGISGQTTPQMLVRFRQDVIALKPSAVVILAGTNDLAGNTGPMTLEMIEANLASMTELAQINGIKVVLSSVLPVFDYPWKPGLEPGPRIAALNAWIKRYAETRGAVYLDYYSAMVDQRQGMRREFSEDGVHPNMAGYRVMAPLAERAIVEALRR